MDEISLQPIDESNFLDAFQLKLAPEQEAFARALHHWYRNRRDFDKGELTPDEYFAWKDSFKA